MSSLVNTPTWETAFSEAPRASLTIRMDVERDGAIPLTELANIARTVQDAVNQIARSLNDRTGPGRPPEYLRKLSALEAVGIDRGSAVLEIEAPHDMEQFPIEFDEEDAGVQAVELFVASLDALARNDQPPREIGMPARKSIGRFLHAVEEHEQVEVACSVGSDQMATQFVPRLVGEVPSNQDVAPEPITSEIVGKLYAVDLENHVYKIRDELGRMQRIRVGEELDARKLARSLIGELVSVSGEMEGTESDQITATAIKRVFSPEASEYYRWNLASALEGVEPLSSIDDLAIPDLSPEEADAFWEAINE